MAEKKENTIGLRHICELLGYNFFIPAYQHCYRWDKLQVQDSLEDIFSSANKVQL